MPSIKTRLIQLLTLALPLVTGCMPDGFLIRPVSTDRQLVETTLLRESWFAPKVAVIDVEGVIINAETPSLLSRGEHPVSFLVEKLDRARRDPNVKGVILRINSPGGAVAAGEIMHDEIRRFRQSTGKPVIAMMMDVAASGGYYIATACDEIIALRSTVTGSIGVIIQLFDVTGTMAKIGIRPNTIKSGEFKAGGSPFEPLSPENREVFQTIVNRMYERFIEVVAQGRPGLDEEKVRAIADGRVFIAHDALELGLIDRIGSIIDAVSEIKCRIKARNVRLVAYHRPLGYVANYYAASPDATPKSGDVNLINVNWPAWLQSGGARFMYLWIP